MAKAEKEDEEKIISVPWGPSSSLNGIVKNKLKLLPEGKDFLWHSPVIYSEPFIIKKIEK